MATLLVAIGGRYRSINRSWSRSWYRKSNLFRSGCDRKTAGGRGQDQQIPSFRMCAGRGNRYLRFRYRFIDHPLFGIIKF